MVFITILLNSTYILDQKSFNTKVSKIVKYKHVQLP